MIIQSIALNFKTKECAYELSNGTRSVITLLDCDDILKSLESKMLESLLTANSAVKPTESTPATEDTPRKFRPNQKNLDAKRTRQRKGKSREIIGDQCVRFAPKTMEHLARSHLVNISYDTLKLLPEGSVQAEQRKHIVDFFIKNGNKPTSNAELCEYAISKMDTTESAIQIQLSCCRALGILSKDKQRLNFLASKFVNQ